MQAVETVETEQMTTENTFYTLLNLLVKYNSAVPRDEVLLLVLTNDIKKQLLNNSSCYSTSYQNVFLQFFAIHSDNGAYIRKVVDALVRCGFDRHAKDSRSGLTPLQWIVTNKGDEYINYLNAMIPDGDVNAAYSKGGGGSRADQFLLLTAVQGGKIQFCKALLDAGAKVDLPETIPISTYSTSPVMPLTYAAAQLGRSDILKLLIDHKADTKKAFNGKTPLVLAAEGVAKGGAMERSFQQCVEMLVPRPPAPAVVAPAAIAPAAKRQLEAAAAGGSAAKRAKAADCAICMDKSAEIAFLPCGHMCVCSTCVLLATKCPMCRKKFTSTAKIFIP